MKKRRENKIRMNLKKKIKVNVKNI